jgi:hypothetical protein
MINWNQVLDGIKTQDGEVRSMGGTFYQNTDGRFNEIITMWTEAGYTPQKVEWINYYPGKHFDQNISDEFSKQVGLTEVRSWISKVRPGKNAPWHQDIDDSMEEYLKLGTLKRFTCHIGTPAHGQILLIDKESFYMVPQGTVVEWPEVMSWHGSSNCGFEDHYLYHFLGYK